MIATIVYNVAMTVVDAACIVALGRRRTSRAWIAAWLLGGFTAAGLAVVVGIAAGQGGFGVMRLAAYGLFGHGVVVLAGSGAVLRSQRPKTALASGLLAVAVAAVAVDAFWVEPTWLEVTHVEITSAKLTQPVRVVLLADVQTDRIGAYEREAFRRAMAEGPDVILLAGDYLQANHQQRRTLAGELNRLLDEIDFSAPAGVFAVQGNVDAGDWADAFDGLPFTTVESTRSLDAAGLRLTCLGRDDSFHPGLELTDDGTDRFHLVLGHSPDYALGQIEADLLVAGHTHGGQVRLPGVGPLLTLSAVSRAQGAGISDLPNGGRLYVSRGIGMERGPAPRLRFLCRPELVVFDLVPE